LAAAHAADPNGVVYNSAVRGDSPAGFWRLNELSGVSSAANEVTGGAALTLTGGTATFGASGLFGADNHAVTFSGANAAVLGGAPGPLPDGSVSGKAWIRTSDASSGYHGILVFAGAGFGLFVSSGKVIAYNLPTGVVVNSNVDVADGKWHQVALVVAGATQKLYVDGVPRGDGAWAVGSVVPNTVVVGNGNKPDNGQRFNGTIDEVSTYNSSLTATQVATHFASVVTCSLSQHSASEYGMTTAELDDLVVTARQYWSDCGIADALDEPMGTEYLPAGFTVDQVSAEQTAVPEDVGSAVGRAAGRYGCKEITNRWDRLYRTRDPLTGATQYKSLYAVFLRTSWCYEQHDQVIVGTPERLAWADRTDSFGVTKALDFDPEKDGETTSFLPWHNDLHGSWKITQLWKVKFCTAKIKWPCWDTEHPWQVTKLYGDGYHGRTGGMTDRNGGGFRDPPLHAVSGVPDAGGDPPDPAPVASPTATTGTASQVKDTSAMLNATVDRQGVTGTSYHFEYGPTTAYGQTTSAENDGLSGAHTYSRWVDGLSVNRTYHYRVVAVNGSWTTYGADQTLTTAQRYMVFYPDSTGLNSLTNWEQTFVGGWTQTPLFGHPVVAGTSPTAVVDANGTPNAVYVDSLNNSTLTVWSRSPTAGWQQTFLWGHRVATGTSPSAVLLNGVVHVFFVDSQNGNTISDWYKSPTGAWQQAEFFGHQVAAGTSPSATVVNGQVHVSFVDSTNLNSTTDWTWTSTSGWQQQFLFGHAVTTGSSTAGS